LFKPPAILAIGACTAFAANGAAGRGMSGEGAPMPRLAERCMRVWL
jgi:hypothetical protein